MCPQIVIIMSTATPYTPYILDQTSSFLSGEDFDELLRHTPPSGSPDWKEAIIHDRRRGINRTAPESRHGFKARTGREHLPLLRWIHRLTIRRLLPSLQKEMDGFGYIFARHSQAEWLRYETGMFFREHQDFERYICNGMIPYVLLIGLDDTRRGGETRVDGRPCLGATRRNGAVFFPSNLPHEACMVEDGTKRCFKMEFFVFREPSPQHRIVVADAKNDWRSYWTVSVLTRVENYVRSHLEFDRRAKDQSESGSTVKVETETAQDLRRIMMTVVDPVGSPLSIKDRAVYDMMFPGISRDALHDMGNVCSATEGSIVMGRTPLAWDLLLRTSHPNELFLVAVWMRENETSGRGASTYRLKMLVDPRGRRLRLCTTGSSEDTPLEMSPPMADLPETQSIDRVYLHYSSIRDRLQCACVQQVELDRHQMRMKADGSPEDGSVWRTLPASTPSFPRGWERAVARRWKDIHALCPSEDRWDRSMSISGTITRSYWEMCNDEDAGMTKETYEEYVSYRIQTRWLRLTL